MADKSSQLVLNALSRAVADPDGLFLHAGRSTPGLFPVTTSGKQAARRCLDEGFIRPLEESAAKPHCVITDKGLSYLLAQVSPRQVLEDFVRVLEARQAQFDALLGAGAEARAGLETLRTNAEKVLQVVGRAEKPAGLSELFTSFRENRFAKRETAEPDILTHLATWQVSGAAEDYPLPDLYRAAPAPRRASASGTFTTPCASCKPQSASTCTPGPDRSTTCPNRPSPCSSATKSRTTPASGPDRYFV